MSDEDLKAELERLRSENAALKKGASTGIRMKVSEKGAVSIYGMGRFPVTLYKEQWLKLLDMSADIRAFIAANDAQLKALIVGKIVSAKNTVTGQRFEVLYGSSGRRLIVRIDGKQPEPGDPFHPNDQMEVGAPAAYEIKDGQIITTLDNAPFAVTVYKVGDKYVAARSNEFGYANYEVEQIEDSDVTTGVVPLPR